MTLDEYLEDVRFAAQSGASEGFAAPTDLLRLLAIIEAQRAEIDRAHAALTDAGEVEQAMKQFGFGGNAAIEARFEKGEI